MLYTIWLMDKSNIITLPNAVLRKRSNKISVISEDTEKLIKNMSEATLSWEDSRDHEVGVALAAVQVGVLKRVVIIRNDFDDKSDRTFQVLINPKIIKTEGPLVEDYEGCLSVKDIYGKVPRAEKVKIKATNAEGHEIRITAEGFLARVIQHEIDHTNGIVFIDHIKDEPERFFRLSDSGELKKLDYNDFVKNNPGLWE